MKHKLWFQPRCPWVARNDCVQWRNWGNFNDNTNTHSFCDPGIESNHSCGVKIEMTEFMTRFLSEKLVQFSSLAQSCPTVCDPMDCSTPGLTVHHQLPEFTQTHVHWVGDAIQPSHPLSSPSLPAPNPSQHQGLFQWVNSSHEVAKVLEFQL